jgi:hypothetical protein
MSSRKAEGFKWQMMELSDGITTSNGNWYHITTDQIKKYVPGLLKKYPLERIIKEADAWVKSADGLSLFVYFLLAYLSVTPWLAGLISIVFFLFWYFNTSAFVALSASPVMKALTNDGVVYVATAILMIGITLNETLSSLGISVDLSALWYGVVLFFFFKVGLLRLLLRFIQSKSSSRGSEMQDRILNMLLIRYGLKTGTLTKDVKQMQDELIEMANYHKTRKKNK